MARLEHNLIRSLFAPDNVAHSDNKTGEQLKIEF